MLYWIMLTEPARRQVSYSNLSNDKKLSFKS